MAFDLASAKPVSSAKPAGFDLASAEPVEPTLNQRLSTNPVFRTLRGAVEPIMGGIQDVAHLVANLPGGEGGKNAAELDRLLASGEKKYQSDRIATGNGGMDVARIAGNIASPINYAIPELAAGRKLGLGARLARGTATGGLTGMLQPVLDTEGSSFGKEKALQGGLGAVGGAAAPLIGAAAGRVITPKLSEDARFLLDKKIRLSLGQMSGANFRAAEDKLSGIPFLGALTSGSQRRATDDFNRAIYNETLRHIGEKMPGYIGNGRKAIAHISDRIGKVYDDTLSKMTGKADQGLLDELKIVVDTAKANGASKDVLDRLENVMQGQLVSKADGSGLYNGNTLKSIQSSLSDLSSEFLSSTHADDHVLGSAIADTHSAFSNMLSRLNPEKAAVLKQADNAWARFARVRNAGAQIGAKDGKFSGPQFASAVRAMDKSAFKGKYAQGKSLFQDFSDAGNNILPAQYPDSGTAGRIMMGSLLAGGAGTAALAAHPVVGATLAGLSGLYTRPGQAMVRGLVNRRGSPIVSNAVNRLSVYGAPGAAQLAEQGAIEGGE